MSTLNPDQWQALSPYLEEALGLEEPERAAWLEALRQHNPALASDLQTLLDEHAAVAHEGFLEQSPVAHSIQPGLAGQTIGSYTLLAPIGQGGMGSVWLAERSDGRFQRQAAIKFVNFALARGSQERFRREGTILGRLAHPHIAELLDAGVMPDGQPYLVLEYVEGKHIDDYCDEHRLDIQARVKLFLDVLTAVGHAHSNLIVHRDIKPSNVLVRNDGQVKLLDFGIAKLLEEEGQPASSTLLTEQAGGALTPAYAAPEQVTRAPITTATDVYALGVLLYVLLTGQHPAGASTRSPAELVKAIVDTEPARMSDAVTRTPHEGEPANASAAKRASNPEKLCRLLRGDLDTIVAKALKKNPQERYASVTAFAEDLRRYLKHEAIGARPDTIAYRTAKFVRRNRTVVTLASLVVLATIAGMVGTLMQARTTRRERDFALRQVDRAEAINEFNEFILSDASPEGKPFTVNQLLDHATHILDREHGANARRLELMGSIGLQYSLAEKQVEARRIGEEAYKLSRGISEPGVRATVSCDLASTLVRDGELGRAESLFQEAMRELPSEGQFAFDRVECLRRGSEVAQERGDAQQGVARMEAAQQVLENSPFDSDWSEIQVLTDLGEAYRVAGENYKATSVFEKVNGLLLSMGRDDTRSAAVLFNDWALALEKLGRPLEAEKIFRQSINLQGENPVLFNNYAITLRTLARWKEATEFSDRSYEDARRSGNQFVLHRALLLRAVIDLDQRDFTHAEAALSELEPILRQNFPPDHLVFGLFASLQSLLASGKGNSQQALTLADQSVANLEHSIKAKGQGADLLPILLIRRATVELAAARPATAEADARIALATFQAAAPSPAFSSLVGGAYLKLGNALQAQGKNQEALAAFHSAAEQLEKTLGPDHPDTRAARQFAGIERPNP